MTGARRAITLEERIYSWIRLGADPAGARWHAALAEALNAWHAMLVGGRIVTSAALTTEEGRNFEALCIRIDLPPNVAGVFLPPALSSHFEPPAQGAGLRRAAGRISQMVLLGSADRPERLVVAELTSTENAPGADVLEKGCRIAAENFGADVADGLSALAWQYLARGGEVARTEAMRYTEWWFRRCAAVGRTDLPLHPAASYIHRPERFGLDTVEAVFRLVEAVLPEVCAATPDEAAALPDGEPLLAEYVQAHLAGLLDLLRRGKIVDFAAFQGETETRFKDGFSRALDRTCHRLLGPAGRSDRDPADSPRA